MPVRGCQQCFACPSCDGYAPKLTAISCSQKCLLTTCSTSGCSTLLTCSETPIMRPSPRVCTEALSCAVLQHPCLDAVKLSSVLCRQLGRVTLTPCRMTRFANKTLGSFAPLCKAVAWHGWHVSPGHYRVPAQPCLAALSGSLPGALQPHCLCIA